MNTFDVSPFFRSTVGFDRLFDQLGRQWETDTTWPQYDVLKTGEDDYQITLAVPGYHQDDIDIETKDSLLTIRGERQRDVDETRYLYRGIGNRSFTRTFQLAEYVKVENARIRDGLLTIELRREVPESMRPRKIEVQVSEPHATAEDPKAVASKAACYEAGDLRPISLPAGGFMPPAMLSLPACRTSNRRRCRAPCWRPGSCFA